MIEEEKDNRFPCGTDEMSPCLVSFIGKNASGIVTERLIVSDKKAGKGVGLAEVQADDLRTISMLNYLL